MQIFFYIGLGFTAFCALTLIILPVLLRPTRDAQRLMEVVASTRPDRRSMSEKERLEEELLTIARKFRSLLGISIDVKSKDRLISAGYRDLAAPEMFFAAQFLVPIAGAFCGSFISSNTLFWVFTLTAVGYIVPNLWLNWRIRCRKNRIRRGLPDAIDLLVICVDAGLGLDQAILRVSAEIALNHPDIQDEFTRVHLEQRAGVPRLETWQNLASRTQIPEFAAFVAMLTQTDRFGTPIVRALSRFSEDIRLKRRQRAEEAAAKTRVKIVFPLVFFIFPCLFIVLLGPAIINIMEGLKGVGK